MLLSRQILPVSNIPNKGMSKDLTCKLLVQVRLVYSDIHCTIKGEKRKGKCDLDSCWQKILSLFSFRNHLQGKNAPVSIQRRTRTANPVAGQSNLFAWEVQSYQNCECVKCLERKTCKTKKRQLNKHRCPCTKKRSQNIAKLKDFWQSTFWRSHKDVLKKMFS